MIRAEVRPLSALSVGEVIEISRLTRLRHSLRHSLRQRISSVSKGIALQLQLPWRDIGVRYCGVGAEFFVGILAGIF